MKKKIISIISILAFSISFISCGNKVTISQEEYDALISENNELKQQLKDNNELDSSQNSDNESAQSINTIQIICDFDGKTLDNQDVYILSKDNDRCYFGYFENGSISGLHGEFTLDVWNEITEIINFDTLEEFSVKENIDENNMITKEYITYHVFLYAGNGNSRDYSTNMMNMTAYGSPENADLILEKFVELKEVVRSSSNSSEDYSSTEEFIESETNSLLLLEDESNMITFSEE